MRTLQRTLGALIFPAIAYLGAACERAGPPTKPTEKSPAPAFNFSSSDGSIQAVPFAFVGKPGDCGPGYPAGSRIVTSAWLGGMGLPDNGGPNFNATDPADAPNKGDPHAGLLLSKNGASPICSSAGARIRGVRGMVLSATSALGFDYRNGGHCGAGAPRFNVVVQNSVTNTQTFHFVGGCANDGAPTLAPQDPSEWTRVRFMTSAPLNPLAFPPIPPGSRVVSITLIDEGLSNKEIAKRLRIEVATVKNHVHNILEKLQVHRRGEAAARVRAALPRRAVGSDTAC